MTPTRSKPLLQPNYAGFAIPEESENGTESGVQDEGKTILADLDRIINNLEQ